MNRKVEGSNPSGCDRLYVVVRGDLPVGLRCAQAGHALIGYVLEHGAPPDNLVVLQVPDLAAIQRVLTRVRAGRHTAFFEPDIDNELTAVAVAPEQGRALSSIPLMR